ncbi:MAG: hypothetical protein JSU63_01645 [Phycisphaerales bacterium]|nr:MAG: hypothetical protein JSU63_01645 [Phycisphaerales bacterium]
MNTEVDDGQSVQSILAKLAQLASVADVGDLGELAKMHELCGMCTESIDPGHGPEQVHLRELLGEMSQSLAAVILGEDDDPAAALASIKESLSRLAESGEKPPTLTMDTTADKSRTDAEDNASVESDAEVAERSLPISLMMSRPAAASYRH